ncbi:MAG TPA: MoaD/ThiS family protein [Verrucomicrobiae bacterium]|nr:MoaD/ThiS family protein [Verrucomicrobiae bacterium]
MNVTIQFFSYFKELTGTERLERSVPTGTTLGALHDELCREHPALREMSRATLLAVGMDYQTRDYVLREGDLVSLFPPVQGG